MKSNAPLTVRELSFARRQRSILQGVTLEIKPGKIACIIGPNGSGKSTLLRCIAGALTPQSGKIVCGESELIRARAVDRAKILSYAPQEIQYSFAFTVREFIGLSGVAGPPAQSSTRLSALIDQLDLAALTERSLLTLSGGERQRAAIVRALSQETPFVLLDEPTAHLDLQHQKLLLTALLEEAQKQERGILLVLHDLNLAAMVSDSLYMLQEGRIYAQGTPREVITTQNIQAVYKTSVRLLNEHENQPTIILSQ